MLMYKIFGVLLAGAAIFTVPAGAQNSRRASIRGNGNPNEGKCTLEVVVDGAADVEIRGDNATLRNINGQQPQWRRFECSSRMPDRPEGFRFRGIDGRGRVQLIQDPRNGGPAVVRIEDSQGGSEGYTFDLEWGGRGDFTGNRPPDNRPPDNRPPDFRPGDRGPVNGGFSAERAVRGCEQAVRQQAGQRFGSPNIDFRGTRIDDNPGRRDWVIGDFAVRRYGREEMHRFTCSVNLADGDIRTVEIDGGGGGGFRGGPARDAVRICRQAVEERIRTSGYDAVNVNNIRVDDRPGRNDWVVGDARGDRGRRSDPFDFSCRVNLDTGEVRTVDVKRR
jgi:hypothetical protein